MHKEYLLFESLEKSALDYPYVVDGTLRALLPEFPNKRSPLTIYSLCCLLSCLDDGNTLRPSNALVPKKGLKYYPALSLKCILRGRGFFFMSTLPLL